MRNPKNTWNLNLQNVKKMHWLHEQLSKIVQAMDLSDILRAEYVLIVSAFDCYVHDVVLQGMTNMFSGSKPDCRAYNEFCLPMSAVKRLLNSTDPTIRESIYNASVKKLLSKDSYQSPKSVEYAMTLINLKKVWHKVGVKLGMPSQDVTLKLGLIIQRRNKIAHEADIHDLVSMDKTPIDRSDADDTFAFLDQIVTAIEDIQTT